MLALNWHALTPILWIALHAILGVLAVILCKRGLYKRYPCFFTYVIYELGEFVFLWAMAVAPWVSELRYRECYYATLVFSVALRFGVIDEISRDLFRDARILRDLARRSLRVITLLLVVASVLLAIYAPGDTRLRWIAGAAVINRGAAMIQAVLLLSLLLSSRFLGVIWRPPAFGITLGLGVLTSVDLGIYALRTQFKAAEWVPYFDSVRMASYLVCMLTWIGYVLVPEVITASVTVVAKSNEVEEWNKELQQLFRQ